jgi:predicted RNase H-like HicB family nuclease
MQAQPAIRYTATYVPVPSGYMGQLLDWPEVVTEGKTVEECRALLTDALHEMILAYRQMQKPIPEPCHITEEIMVEA